MFPGVHSAVARRGAGRFKVVGEVEADLELPEGGPEFVGRGHGEGLDGAGRAGPYSAVGSRLLDTGENGVIRQLILPSDHSLVGSEPSDGNGKGVEDRGAAVPLSGGDGIVKERGAMFLEKTAKFPAHFGLRLSTWAVEVNVEIASEGGVTIESREPNLDLVDGVVPVVRG